MHVRTFYADTLDEALKEIKKELGPDAIILKTSTNKGIKGAFKKHKIEIQAAISERNYVKKAKVDKVLSTDQKEKFYKNNSTYINDVFHPDEKRSSSPNSYGHLGLNKTVQTLKKEAEEAQSRSSSLDSFLGSAERPLPQSSSLHEFISNPGPSESPVEERQAPLRQVARQLEREQERKEEEERPYSFAQEDKRDERIHDLERDVHHLKSLINDMTKEQSASLKQLRLMLKSFDIDNDFIKDVIQRLSSFLSEDELNNIDTLYDQTLQMMADSLKMDGPLFSKEETQGQATLTVLVSEASCGQTSTMLKLGAILQGSVLVQYTKEHEKRHLAEGLFDKKIIRVSSLAEAVSECRKAIDSGQSVFLDYRTFTKEINEVKKFIEGLDRSFERLEVLLTLSAIHSEVYNRKALNIFGRLCDGIILTHLDLCLDFGAIFNLYTYTEKLPFKFFATGDVVPDDIESATKERILAGIFQLT